MTTTTLSLLRFGWRALPLLALVAVLSCEGGQALSQEEQPPADEPRDQAEVLVRGPVHEAFANPVGYDPAPGPVVPSVPPEPIEEVPPETRPEGDDVVWIPGYWAWDVDREDFIWVSGVWRVAPPDRRWVPGYWTAEEGGHRRVPGFWAAWATTSVEYRSQPPASLEQGPSSPQPSADHVWAPGCWVWRDAGWAWRPGYWVAVRPGWVWVPSSWVWTPSGCVFVRGYWDYPVVWRGLLFAPVWFPHHRVRHGLYRPSVVIEVSVLTAHLFASRVHHHYFFGDYYAVHYVSLGIHPWFSFHWHRHGYDPIFAYERWYHRRRVRAWERQVRDWYRYRRDHPGARPPRKYAARSRPADGDRDPLAVPLAKVKDRPRGDRLTTLKEGERSEQKRHAAEIAAIQELRRRSEERAVAAGEPGRPAREKLELPAPAMKRPEPGRPTARAPGREPARPPVREPARPPVREPARPPVREPARPPVREPARPPVREPARPPVREPARPPVREPARPPVREPARPPVREPARPPVREPARPPVRRSSHEPVRPAPRPTRPAPAAPHRTEPRPRTPPPPRPSSGGKTKTTRRKKGDGSSGRGG